MKDGLIVSPASLNGGGKGENKMKKIKKSALALFLAGIMAFTPAGECMAANMGTDNNAVAEVETEAIVEETVVEEQTTVEETVVEETVVEETTTEVADVEETTETEVIVETEETTEEVAVEVETEAADTEEVEETTEEETTEEETTEEETTEVETAELEIPGMSEYTLSQEQLENKADLASHLSEIENDQREGVDYLAGELVFLAETQEEAESIAAGYGGTLESFEYGVGVVKLAEGVTVSQALRVAATSTDVVLVPAWPNYIYKASTELDTSKISIDEAEKIAVGKGTTETVEDDTYTSNDSYEVAAKSFNDPFLKPTSSNYQWQHAMVGSAYAWNAGYTGSGVKVAILDTGVNAHNDLNVIGNYNFTDESSAADTSGHGTHVAGLTAAKVNNNLGGAGIAPEASIVNIKVLGVYGGASSWIMRGINQAVELKVDIINMSLGGAWYSGDFAQVVENAYQSGVVVFAAAGNDASKIKCYPAAYKGAYCVGAVQENKERTFFSNYGSWVHYSAPGHYLWSTGADGTWEIMSGTSQATPVVSGTAAVLLSSDASIQEKTGKARVDALIAKMNKGKVAGKGGAAGIVSLPKALGIAVSTAKPNAPVFEVKTNTTFNTETATITIKPSLSTNTVYYSTDGKTPTFKNGVLSNGTKYTGEITIGGNAKVTVKAIEVNACGLVSKVASATYKFAPQVSSVVVSGDSTIIKGKSTTLKAAVYPEYAKNKNVTWESSDKDAVKVSAKGKVTVTANATAGKTYVITATAKDGKDGKTVAGTIGITVKEAAAIKSVVFEKKSDSVERGKDNVNYDLGAICKVTTVNDGNGTVADVNWSSDNKKVATVNSNGIVTAVGAGKVTITATANDGSGKKASFKLTVVQKVTDITVSGSSALSNGKSIKLVATTGPVTATNKKVKWSVAPEGNGVTVAANGTVKASGNAKTGQYTITATAEDGSNVTGSKVITVSDNAISQIKLDNSSITIFRTAGNYNSATSATITATVTAKSGNSNALEFTSSNPGIATVTWNGTTAVVEATGKATGITVITCKATDGSGKSAKCKVKVVNPASNLTIAPPGGNDGYVAKGKQITLSAVFDEEFGSTSSKKVTWKSNNENYATVDKNGKVKGLVEGKVVEITATVDDGSGVTASYLVAVTTPIKSLRIGELWEGNIITKIPYGYGLNAGDYITVLYDGNMWSSSSGIYPYVSFEVGNPDMISVGQTQYGGIYTLNAMKKGSTTITVKALDGSNVKKTYKVMVY